ncbi:AaceriACR019Wp [[Ashbya] aceris (nom. inval.)]|nr:AaceriACR019Wp [[Ashbya] aceris (nom. inval.)]
MQEHMRSSGTEGITEVDRTGQAIQLGGSRTHDSSEVGDKTLDVAAVAAVVAGEKVRGFPLMGGGLLGEDGSLSHDMHSLGKRQRILKDQLQSMSPQERLERQRAMRRKRDNAYRARKRATELTVDPELGQLFMALDKNKKFHSISAKYDAAALSPEFFPRVLLTKAETDDAALYKAPFDTFIECLRNKIRNFSGTKLSKERTSVHVTSVSCVLYCSQDKSHQRLLQAKETKKNSNLDNLKQYHCQSYMRVNYSFKTQVLSIKFRHIQHGDSPLLIGSDSNQPSCFDEK